MAKVSDLPEELLDAVFEQLDRNRWMDKIILRRCSLVCKSWSSLSRRHLFRSLTVHLTVDKYEAEFVQTSTRTLHQLLQFLTDHRHIAHHIKTLSCVNETAFLEDTYSRALFRDIFLRLPQLKVLQLDDMHLESATPGADPPTLRLDKLVVQAPKAIDEEGTLDVVGLVKSVGVLELVEIELDPFDLPQLLRCPTYIQPHSLILRHVSTITYFLAALQAAGVTDHVSSVSLHRIESLEEIQAVSRFLALVCENLVYLDVDFCWAIMIEGYEFDMDSILHLSKSDKLQTLVLKCEGLNFIGPKSSTFWSRLRQLLITCQRNTSTLRNVKIEFEGYYQDTDADFRSLKACLAETLDSSRTSQTVTIVKSPAIPENPAEMGELSHLCDAGILRFEE